MKANAPIPMGPDASHTGEVVDPLTLLIYPAANAAANETVLYEDEGDGFDHENGGFARRTVSCEESGDRITVRVGEREGSFVPQRENLRLELRGFGAAPDSVTVNGESAESSHENGTLFVPLTEADGEVTVEIVR
jgi:alpha-glucosidase